MIKQKSILIAVFLLLLSSCLSAQDDCLSANTLRGNMGDLDSLTSVFADRLPQRDFYLIGEAHTFLANNDLQFAMIKALHKYGVYNIVNELPHATCFLFNEYLDTGDEAILRSIKPAATYAVLKKVRQYNQSLPAGEQVRYYGIDYLNPKYDYNNYRISLKRILARSTGRETAAGKLIDALIQKDSLVQADIKTFNETLAGLLRAEADPYKKHFGAAYYDLLLMTGNMLGYRSNRDAAVYQSFLDLYKNLRQTGRSTRFLAFYGLGHLGNLGTKYLAAESSPLKGGLAKIALHYHQCHGGWYHSPGKIMDAGIDYKLSRKTAQALELFNKTTGWTVAFLAGSTCLQYKNTEACDGVVIFSRYGNRRMNSWKFD